MIATVVASLAVPLTALGCKYDPIGDSVSIQQSLAPTDDDAFLIKLSLSSNMSLSLYDYESPAEQFSIFDNGLIDSSVVFFKPSAYDCYAGATPGGNAIEASFFGFSFSQCGDTWLEYDLLSANGDFGLLVS